MRGAAEDMPCGEDELREFCPTQIGRYKMPKAVCFVTDLPRGPPGKVQRLKLLELNEATGEVPS